MTYPYEEFGNIEANEREAAMQARLNHAVTGLSQLIADIEPIAITGRLRKSLSDARASLDKACRS